MNDQEACEFYADPENREPAGPPRKRKRPARTAAKTIRFDPALVQRAERLAAAWGLSFSSWIHAAVQREEYRQRVKWLDGHRDELEVVPGSGRAGTPRAIPSSLSLRSGRTFSCPHMSVGNVISASCETCGPLEAA